MNPKVSGTTNIMSHRVVITGMGVVSSNASNLEEFKDALVEGKSGIEHIQELQELGFRCEVGGIAKISENENFRTYDLDRASNYIQLACVAGMEAWENAGLTIPSKESTEVDWDTGILIGTGLSGIDIIGSKVVPLTNEKAVKRIGGYAIINIMGSGSSANLSSILGTGNLSSGSSNACSSGTDAIVAGYNRIKYGDAQRMLVGGSEGYSPYHWASMDSLRVFNSKMNHAPERASRPMSETAGGFTPSSGAGILVLENRELALKRGATILAEITGGLSNSGGHRNGGTFTYPNSEGVVRCIKTTMDMAGLLPDDVDLINGHLTATKGDLSEISNWRQVFNTDKFPMVNATKSLVGHSTGSSGAIECIATILQMRDSFVHPSLNCEDLNPEIGKLIPSNSIVTKTLHNVPINVAIKASFGFGDVNSALIFQK
jgi:3-oxoacyl-[acyl-carrier-protein] synthase-1